MWPKVRISLLWWHRRERDDPFYSSSPSPYTIIEQNSYLLPCVPLAILTIFPKTRHTPDNNGKAWSSFIEEHSMGEIEGKSLVCLTKRGTWKRHRPMWVLPFSRCLHPSPPVIFSILSFFYTTQALPCYSLPGIAPFCTKGRGSYATTPSKEWQIALSPWMGSGEGPSCSQFLGQRKLWLITVQYS